MSEGHDIQRGEVEKPGGGVEGGTLLAAVYSELRRLAQAKMAQETPNQTLQATALVHEAWIRLVGRDDGPAPAWRNRAHFFGAAAEAMRRILIDRARHKLAQRHGGGQSRVEWPEMEIAAPLVDDGLLAINDALEKFAHEDPEKAELVKLRYFVGIGIPEAAEILGISERTAQRHWAYAKAWLKHEVSKS